MYLILLTFGANKAKAPDHMAGHNAWIAKGMSDGVFLLVGSLQPQAGGAILAHGEDRDAIAARVAADPFVAEGVVTPTIHEITPGKADPRLAFLLS